MLVRDINNILRLAKFHPKKDTRIAATVKYGSLEYIESSMLVKLATLNKLCNSDDPPPKQYYRDQMIQVIQDAVMCILVYEEAPHGSDDTEEARQAGAGGQDPASHHRLPKGKRVVG